MIGTLDAKIPHGPLDQKWRSHRDHSRLVSPNNRRKFEIIVVGSGLAGASAAATLGELGYRVKCFCFQDSPRRAHSIAAQGGINAAKNYQNDGDSVYRLFYDTIKGGDFRSREANVYRLAEVSQSDHRSVRRARVPFAREYGGLLANRSFGGAQVSRTFYARGQTGQQLLLGCYQALCRQIAAGNVQMFPQTEMLDLVIVDGHAKGIITRSLRSGKIDKHAADAVVLAPADMETFFISRPTPAAAMSPPPIALTKEARSSPIRAFTQIHPTCIPVSGEHQSKLTLMSESLRNDGRVWVPKAQGRLRQSARRNPGNGSRLLSRAKISELRQSCAARYFIARGKGSLRRRPRRRPGRTRRLSRFCRRDQASRAKIRFANATEICSRSTKRSPAKTPTKCRCEFTRQSTTRWAVSGWIII